MRHGKLVRAFTMVELLVVIGIIGILVAVLLPALSTVTKTAHRTKTQAVFTAISTGLETYRNATGDPYPPSRSDAPSDGDAFKAAKDNETDMRYVCGANLLTWALVGRDLLGTAGFKDIANEPGWYDDVHARVPGAMGGQNAQPGLYALDATDYEPRHRRYSLFLDVNENDIATFGDYYDEKLNPRGNNPLPMDDADVEAYRQERFLLDGFGYPILYYRANRGARGIVTFEGDQVGVYAQADNALYTGGADTDVISSLGMDLGAGDRHNLQQLDDTSLPPNTDLNLAQYDATFARFIWDRQVNVRLEPVKKDSYILVSAGPDAIWGTDDDVTNFGNEGR